MKRFDLSLTLAAAAAASLAGCNRPAPAAQAQDWSAGGPTQYCTDVQNRRVPDDYCRQRTGGGGLAYFPWFIGRGGYIPPYGALARDGGRSPAPGVAYGRAAAFTSAPRGSGAVSRGGFGSSAHASAGE